MCHTEIDIRNELQRLYISAHVTLGTHVPYMLCAAGDDRMPSLTLQLLCFLLLRTYQCLRHQSQHQCMEAFITQAHMFANSLLHDLMYFCLLSQMLSVGLPLVPRTQNAVSVGD